MSHAVSKLQSKSTPTLFSPIGDNDYEEISDSILSNSEQEINVGDVSCGTQPTRSNSNL